MTWHDLLADAILAFGDTPGATLEQHLLDAYTEHPAAVAVAIGKITRAHQSGKINSPWGAVKAELTKQMSVRRNLPDSSDRATHGRNTEQWMRTCGLHYDRWTEIHDELFGSRGKLKPWADDQALEARLRKLYDEVRPSGEQLEHEELDRADKWKTTRPAKETKAA